jgi:hypothetical protein
MLYVQNNFKPTLISVDNGHMSACPCDDLKEEQNERFHLGSLVS